jgi:hypothetical protein
LLHVTGLWVLLALSIAAAIAWLLIVKLFENSSFRKRMAARKQKQHDLPQVNGAQDQVSSGRGMMPDASQELNKS